MASSSDYHYHGGRHGRRTFQAPVIQNLKFYKGTQPSSPSVNQGTAVQPVHRSECGRPPVNGRPGMIPVLEKTIHWKYLLFGANLVTTLQIVNISSVVVFSNFTRGPAEIWDIRINNHDVQGRTGVLPPFSTFVLPVLLGDSGLGEIYKLNSIFAQNA